MKTIVRVAKTELRTLFYSPIAWFLLVVFLIQCAITYFSQLESQARTQEIAGIGLQYMTRLTERIFAGRGGLFSSVFEKLYLFIPLLTMGLISRETSSGTIKLLYSSPIKVREIVFGKYLAMMVYSLLLVAIMGIFLVAGMFHIKNPDGGLLVSGAIGFYLLLLAYSAIGLFMSCLTTYQVVAALCTFVMIGILSYIGTLWQDIDFVRDLTYFLSLNGRAEKMLVGMITTKDILYFLVIVYIFLGLSIYKLRAGMESKPAWIKAGRYIAIVASALLIGYISSFPSLTGYFDMTANKSRTLTPNAQSIIKELGDEPLEVTAYNNFLGRYSFFGMPVARNQDLARWEPYIRFKNNINLKYVQYYDSTLDVSYMMKMYPGKSIKEIAEQYAKGQKLKMSMFKTPAEIRKEIDLRPELNRYVMQLKWKGRTTMLRVFDDQMMWPSETEVAAAFKRLLQAKLPKVAFVTGDLERNIEKMSDKDYKALTKLSTFRNSLVNQGFDVDTLTLETQDIPADISTLVIADPKIALSTVAITKLQQYIDKGGNLMICGEPGRQSLLNPLLQPLGVQLMEGQLVQQSDNLSPEIVTPDLTNTAASLYKPLVESKEDSMKVSMPGVAGLSYNSGGAWTIEPLLMTNSKLSWSKKKKLDLELVTSADATAGEKETPAGPATAPTRTKTPYTAVKPGAVTMKPAIGNDPTMEERKKKALAMQAQMNAIGKGEGTPEEKQQKVRELMMKANQEAQASLTPQQRKTNDSIRTVMTGIMNGPGTPEEKRQKASEVMASLRKANTSGPVASKPVAIKAAPIQATPAPSAPSGGGVAVAMVSTGGMMPMSSSGGDDRKNIGTVSFSAADGDVRGSFPTVLRLTRKLNGKEQRIVVAGDADFMSNVELNRFNMRTANFNFNTALFSWLSYGAFPIDTSRPDAKDKRVAVTTDGVDRLKLFYLWILPGIVIAFATILLIRRKRK
jgi:ABC-2 type transport system permease protein